MKCLIISDNHGKTKNFYEALKHVGSCDCIIHCGDGQIEKRFYELEANCPVYLVRGNCDYGENFPLKEVIELEGHRILIVHGHRQNVKWDLTQLELEARESEVEIVFFGHTHEAEIIREKGLSFVNPGSLEYPRGTRPSYAVMQLENGHVDIQIQWI